MKICPVIISGGSGTRLWPISRASKPKQFIQLTGDESLFKKTLNRSSALKSKSLKPIIVTNEEHRFLVSQQLLESKSEGAIVILEPVSKNTAPAITLAAAYLEKNISEDCLLLISPADHMIRPEQEFIDSIEKSIDDAKSGSICTFGIIPTNPNTGYGYIETGKRYEDLSFSNQVISFTEKPDLVEAKKFLQGGKHFWNSGIYLLSLSTYLTLMDEIEPEITKYTRKSIANASSDSDFLRPEKESFSQVESISIDHALMEKVISKGASVRMQPLKLEWSDIGSISSLSDLLPKDEDLNSIYGDVIHHDNKGSFLHSSGGLIASIGLKDMIVIKTSDAVLVAPKDRDQEIKVIVDILKSKNREEASLHKEVNRPWGSYEVLYEGDSFKIKIIKVNPGAQLSLQMHQKRSEHWVVVKGVADVILGDSNFKLLENESTFIPAKTKHSLGNTNTDILEIIEVQTGTYLGEDDITRYEDKYGRVT